MIASLSGRITDLTADSVVIEVGGIGIQVFVTHRFRDGLRVGEKVYLHTYLAVREDSLTLFGFETVEEKEFFVLLLGVNGVGTRLALAGISTLTPDAIRRAVFTEQADVFSRIPGIGKKTAQKMLLHLQDKIKAVDGPIPRFLKLWSYSDIVWLRRRLLCRIFPKMHQRMLKPASVWLCNTSQFDKKGESCLMVKK